MTYVEKVKRFVIVALVNIIRYFSETEIDIEYIEEDINKVVIKNDRIVINNKTYEFREIDCNKAVKLVNAVVTELNNIQAQIEFNRGYHKKSCPLTDIVEYDEDKDTVMHFNFELMKEVDGKVKVEKERIFMVV